MLQFFKLYELKPSFSPPAQAVREAYIRIQKESHPDFFANDSEKYMEALELSALNNEAFKSLKDFYSTTEYILREYGLLQEGEKNMLSPEFLAEMLDLNDLIAESAFGDSEAAEKAEKLLQQLEAANFNEMQSEASRLESLADWTVQELTTMKLLFQQHKYLSRLRKNLAGI